MADFQKGIPDITVVVTKGSEYVSSIQPSEVYQVLVNTGDSYLVNVDQPYTIVVDGSGSYIAFSDFASYANSSSFATTASYAISPQLPEGSVSSSYQIGLNEISGSIFSASNFTFPQDLTIGGTLFADKIFISSSVLYESGSTKFGDSLDDTHQFTGSVLINGQLQVPSITGSFKGDGSQLTGLVTDLRISGSVGSDTVSLLTDTLFVVGENPVVTTVTNNQIAISIPTGYATTASNVFVGDQTVTGSVDVLGDIWVTPGIVNQLTSSYAIKAENIGIINAGFYETGSQQAISSTLGIQQVTSASYAVTASYALNVNLATSSYAVNALTASYAMNGGTGGGLTSSLLSIDQYYFVGDGVTTNFTLLKAYSDYSLIISVGGVTFISPNDYTITGNTITFYEPPYSGSNIFVRGFVNVTQGATGSFSGSFIGIATTASYAVTASHAGSVNWSNVSNKPTGIVSSSTQISQSGFVSSSTINTIQTITSASYAAITPVSGTLYIIID